MQLRALRPDLKIEPLRGNLDTRLRKLDEGQYDAIVLAAAGLKRLGLSARIRGVFEPAEMLPAAGQGALGLEMRAEPRRCSSCWHRSRTRPPGSRSRRSARCRARSGGSCSMPREGEKGRVTTAEEARAL